MGLIEVCRVYAQSYALRMLGITGTSATVNAQLGYTIADVLAKPVFGLLMFAIAVMKTKADQENSSMPEAIHAPELDMIPAPAQP
jgi:hypothetical protein